MRGLVRVGRPHGGVIRWSGPRVTVFVDRLSLGEGPGFGYLGIDRLGMVRVIFGSPRDRLGTFVGRLLDHLGLDYERRTGLPTSRGRGRGGELAPLQEGVDRIRLATKTHHDLLDGALELVESLEYPAGRAPRLLSDSLGVLVGLAPDLAPLSLCRVGDGPDLLGDHRSRALGSLHGRRRGSFATG